MCINLSIEYTTKMWKLIFLNFDNIIKIYYFDNIIHYTLELNFKKDKDVFSIKFQILFFFNVFLIIFVRNLKINDKNDTRFLQHKVSVHDTSIFSFQN